MRVLFVTHNFPRWTGDRAGGFVLRIARAAQAAGHEVRVVAPHAPGATTDEVRDGVPVRRFRYAPDALERIGYQGDVRRSLGTPLALLALPAYAVAFRRAVAQAVRAFEPALIHAHWWVPGGWAAVGQGIPVLITCHGSDVRLLTRSAAVRRLARRVLPQAARIGAVSEVMRADLAAAVPAVAGRLRTTYLPVEPGPFLAVAARPRVSPPRILFAGNLIPAKGPDVVLRAYAELRRAGLECRLRFVGEGSARRELEALAVGLGVADQVEWAGVRPHHEMPEEFAAATVTVLASRGPRGEGLPLTAVEALLAGSAVVASPAGGTVEVVRPEETGLLFADGDVTGLSAALRRMLTDGAFRRATATAGQALARERFAPDRANAAILALYDEARAERAR